MCVCDKHLHSVIMLGAMCVCDRHLHSVIMLGAMCVCETGTFIRHSCGAFGETGSHASIINRINHLFDCIEMASSFQFTDGTTTFYNRYNNRTHLGYGCVGP